MRVVRIILAPVFWLGRVSLWIVFWPLGLWRSIRHSQSRRDRKLREAIERSHRQP